MPATYESIATTTVSGSSTNAINFSSFGGYTDLILQVSNQMSGASGFKIRFNSDTNSNYSITTMQGFSNTPTSYRAASAAGIHNNLVFGDSTTANIFTPNTIQIQNYSNTNMYKSVIWRWGTTNYANTNGDMGALLGMWRSTSAITSIEVSAWNAVNFVAGTTATLYGIAQA